MLEINLLPVREARRKADLRQYFMQLVLVVIVVVGGAALIQSRMSDRIERTEARVAQMRNDIDQFKPQLEQVAAFKKRKAELEKKIDVIDGLDRARSGPVRVLSELSTRIPDRLWLTSLSTKGGEIALKGQSLDNELVALFLRHLSESEVFTKVDLEGTKLGSDGKGGLKTVQFGVKAQLAAAISPATAAPKPAAKPAPPKAKG